MRTVILGDQPPDIAAFLARRRALDQDRSDEVWEGEYHVVPAPHPWHAYIGSQLTVLLDPFAERAGLFGLGGFNLGQPDNFRVPDAGYVRSVPNEVFVPTAAIVLEILSPHDETWEKLEHYARHGVEELGIVDPPARRVGWFARRNEAYEESGGSDLLGITGTELEGLIDWPG